MLEKIVGEKLRTARVPWMGIGKDVNNSGEDAADMYLT